MHVLFSKDRRQPLLHNLRQKPSLPRERELEKTPNCGDRACSAPWGWADTCRAAVRQGAPMAAPLPPQAQVPLAYTKCHQHEDKEHWMVRCPMCRQLDPGLITLQARARAGPVPPSSLGWLLLLSGTETSTHRTSHTRCSITGTTPSTFPQHTYNPSYNMEQSTC